MMTRTRAGLALERLLSSIRTWDDHPLRHLFCYNGSEPDTGYECACCMTWPDDKQYETCGCICHERVEKMARTGDFPLLVSALVASDEFPKFPSNWEEEEIWRKLALEEDHTHYHNTNGKFANYPKLVCSTCCPSDDRPQVKYNTKTGKLLRESFPGPGAPGNNEGGPLDEFPRQEGGWLVPHVPEISEGTPETHEDPTPQTPPGPSSPREGESGYVWRPGRCT